MKFRNILHLILASLLLCLSSVTLADKASDEMLNDSINKTADGLIDETVDKTVDKTVDETSLIVNINEADAKTIARVLLNIGIKKAQAIVDYREKYGHFYSAEELSAVRGIGQRTIEKNEGRITTQ